jgi:hypothetical protein
MQVSSLESAGMAASTCSRKVGARFPPTGAGGGGTSAFGIVFASLAQTPADRVDTVTAGGDRTAVYQNVNAHDSSRQDAGEGASEGSTFFDCPLSLRLPRMP